MKTESPQPRRARPRLHARRALGWLGAIIALPFFLWIPGGFVPGIPDMIEVFGVSGLRTPAAIAITGLLLAAVGFHEA